MEKADVDRWLQEYVAAWKVYDPDRIGDLFAEDVEYRYHPYDEPVRGRTAVVASWLGEGGQTGASTRDEPGTFDAVYQAIAVDGEVAVAKGSSTYLTAPGGAVDKVYDNCFFMRFNPAGQCREFTEWYIQRPSAGSSSPTPRATNSA